MLSTIHGIHGVVALILVIAAVICVLAGAWRCWLRDFFHGAVLIVVGIILFALS